MPPGFQDDALHRVLPGYTRLDDMLNAQRGRLSITFRTVHTEPTVMTGRDTIIRAQVDVPKMVTTKVNTAVHNSREPGETHVISKWQWQLPEKGGLSYDTIYAAVQPFLVADTVQMFGKTCDNNGRQVAAFRLPGMDMTEYKYSRKVVKVYDIPTEVRQCQDVVEAVTGHTYNWAHVVYYPNHDAKLAWHADDEKLIAPNTAIAGLSFFQSTSDSRRMQFKAKKPKEAKKKLAAR
jgi:alkylated DNA repair dioxygenase AlkB